MALRTERRAEGRADFFGGDGAKDLLVVCKVLYMLSIADKTQEGILPRRQICIGKSFTLVDQEGASNICQFAGTDELCL